MRQFAAADRRERRPRRAPDQPAAAAGARRSQPRKAAAVEPLDLERAGARGRPRSGCRAPWRSSIDLGFEGTGWPLPIDGNAAAAARTAQQPARQRHRVHAGRRPRHRAHARRRAWRPRGRGRRHRHPVEDERDRVFERFYRVLGTEADGSGLGLPIVREIADLHRATMSLDASAAMVSVRGLSLSSRGPRRAWASSRKLRGWRATERPE